MAHRNRVFVVVLGLALATAFGRPDDVGPVGSPAPTAVSCEDAARLRERAADVRRLALETTSDQVKVIAGNRAVFYTSLAITADLKCNSHPSRPIPRWHARSQPREKRGKLAASTSALSCGPRQAWLPVKLFRY